MTAPPRPDVSDEGQPLAAAGGQPHESAPADPPNPATKPQGTLHDQEANMESEGQPTGPETTSKD